MMRRVFMLVFLALMVVAVGFQYGKGEAADQYIGTYRDGTEAYLISDSVVETMIVSKGVYFGGYNYECKVKAVYPDTMEYYTIDYMFACNTGRPYWIKDGVKQTASNRDLYPVEMSLLNYFYSYSQSAHPNQWKSEKVLQQ